MLFLSRRRLAAATRHIQRTVAAGGFRTELTFPTPTLIPEPAMRAQSSLDGKRNVLLTGPDNTHKLSSLVYLGREMERKGVRVGWTSFSHYRAVQLEGITIFSFLGIRPVPSPVVEQVASGIERHARNNDLEYGSAFPTVANVDVLVIDGMQNMSPEMLTALDVAARRIRQRPNEPFGGLRILGSANFFRIRNIDPSSPNNGYLFQLPALEEFFDLHLTTGLLPLTGKNATTCLEPFHKPRMAQAMWRAFLGTLTKQDARIFQADDSQESAEGDADSDSASHDPSGGVSFVAPTALPRQFDAVTHRAEVTTSLSKVFASTIFGLNAYKHVAASTAPLPAFGMPAELVLVKGQRVRLAFDMLGNGAGAQYLPRSSAGTILESTKHYVRVQFDELSSPVDVRPLRVTTSLTNYPAVAVSTQQIPLIPNAHITLRSLLGYPSVPKRIRGDAVMTETNSVGNVLSRYSSASNIRIDGTQLATVARNEGMVHDAARIFYEALASKSGAMGDGLVNAKAGEKQWCRNCKEYFPQAEFYSHWTACVEKVRWCQDCSKTVELAKWDAHAEKHTIVLCFDCGKSFQWKQWDQHRLSCEGLLKELSPENPLLPASTRHLVIEQVHSRGDLNTVAKVQRSGLPKQSADVKIRTKIQNFM